MDKVISLKFNVKRCSSSNCRRASGDRKVIKSNPTFLRLEGSEIVLPGVEKKDISFKITDVSFYVKAKKESVTYMDKLCNLLSGKPG